MNLLLLRNDFRRVAGDRGVPPIWPNDDVIRWLNEAVAEAATRAFLLNDRTTAAVCEVTLVPDQIEYQLHPSVLNIESVDVEQPGGRTRGATVATYDEIRACHNYSPNLRGWGRRWHLYGEGNNGPRLILDRAPGEAGGKLLLSVFRLPLVPMEDDADEPEIHPRHHDGLLDWALFRAYSVRDIEAFAPQRAAGHEQAFTRRFGERMTANVQRKHKRHRAPVCRPIAF